ncbi:GFA family protein [Lysobacter terrae]
MTTHQGSCHCGQVAFEVDGDIGGAMSCNCSMCQRKGSLLWFVPRAQLRITQGEKAMATYMFNRHVIKHHFCPACGIHPFGEGTDPKGNAMAAINIRCLTDIELESVPVQHYDGRSK